MIKATRINQYNKINKNGQLMKMYVYKITSGTAEELADFQLLQGVNYRTDTDGAPIYHTSRFYGNHIDLIRGKVKEGQMLVDAYRPMTSEDFELKSSLYERQTAPITASVPVSAPVIATVPTIDMDAQF